MHMHCSPDWHGSKVVDADYYLVIKSRSLSGRDGYRSFACCADHLQQALGLVDIQPGEDATLRRAG